MRLKRVVSFLLVWCTLAALPAAGGQSAQDIGTSLVNTLKGRDVQAIVASIDPRQMSRRIGLPDVTEDGVPKMLEGYFRYLQAQAQAWKLVRVKTQGNQTLVMIRLDRAAPGTDFLEFICEPGPTGGFQVIDWYSLSQGEWYSAMARTQLKLMTGDPETFRALFGNTPINADVTARVGTLLALMYNNRNKEALLAMEQLPVPIAESRYVLLKGLSRASPVDDRAAYARIARKLAEKYGDDPTVAFRLIDYYLTNGQTDALVRASTILEQRVGPDITPKIVRATALWQAQARDGSIWNLQDAVRAEPDSQFAWKFLATRYVEMEDFPTAIAVYRTMQARFGTRFDRAYFEEGGKCYENQSKCPEFLQSEAFKQWLPEGAGAAGSVTEPLPPPPPPPPLGTVANILVQNIKDCNTDAVYNLIDTGALAVRAEKLAHVPFRINRASKYGLVGALLLLKCESKGIGVTAVKLMRVEERDGEKRALVRFSWDRFGAGDYLEFVMEPDVLGRFHVVDWYGLTAGETRSQILWETRQLLESVAPAPGAAGQDALNTIDKMLKFQNEGRYAEAIGVMSDLPTAAVTSRFLLNLRVQMARIGNLKSQYVWALDMLAEKYGADPSLTMRMVEYYTEHQQYDKALECAGAVEQRVGSDGLTNLMKENVEWRAGAYDKALSFASRAIDLEPDMMPAWYALARDNVGLKNYAQAVAVLQKTQTRFGIHYTREDLVKDPGFGDFVQSAPFQKWLPQ